MSSIRFDHHSLIGGKTYQSKINTESHGRTIKTTIQQLLARFYDGNITAYNVREGGKERFDRK